MQHQHRSATWDAVAPCGVAEAFSAHLHDDLSRVGFQQSGHETQGGRFAGSGTACRRCYNVRSDSGYLSILGTLSKLASASTCGKERNGTQQCEKLQAPCCARQNASSFTDKWHAASSDAAVSCLQQPAACSSASNPSWARYLSQIAREGFPSSRQAGICQNSWSSMLAASICSASASCPVQRYVSA